MPDKPKPLALPGLGSPEVRGTRALSRPLMSHGRPVEETPTERGTNVSAFELVASLGGETLNANKVI